MYEIKGANAENFSEIMEVWESSVNATHHFLSDKDKNFYRNLIEKEYLKQLDIHMYVTGGICQGFMGILGESLEMLFVAGDHRRQGIGSTLLNFAVARFTINKVDVNEENMGAFNFYTRFGFIQVGRSDKDGTGKPYPIIHMKLGAEASGC